ncbi:stemmadenine O-acetyltransferase-like [Lotus japonicus]|uniref:stemmadenine O-acetyltransferase-like n=1 Tax=Lotus japonicus TaxID=34305 RepID=UPI002586EA42|nr:stemmadenine O-acetyltransferase-like [Lotus japonicus]
MFFPELGFMFREIGGVIHLFWTRQWSDNILVRNEVSSRELKMEMELISRETITPSEPTPLHLRIYPLSFIDQIIQRNYIPSLFFYQPNKLAQECHQRSKISELKKSLSQVLSKYYPFAGSLRDELSIECNDQGVSFLVTKITGTKLSTILQNPNETLLNPLFPDELQWEAMSSGGSIVAIQINCFACGGMAISVCMCHKVGDAATLFNFVNDWATMNREEGELLLPSPLLDGGVSVFPQGDLPVFTQGVFVKDKMVVCRRFVFQASKIKSLTAMIFSQSNAVQNQNLTRFEVVTAWIYKRAISALGLNSKTTSFLIPVNLRRRMVPLLPDKCVGNMVWWYLVFNPVVDEREMELHELVSKIKEGLCEFCDVYPKKFGGSDKDLPFISECLKQATSSPEPCESDHEENQSMFIFTSWCRFPMYEVDFGWGKPIWVTTSECPAKNSIILMDTRDGDGIEAIVNMEEKDMTLFEHNVELLQYASLNPDRGIY